MFLVAVSGAALQRRRYSGDIAPVMLAAEVIAWA